MRGECTHTRRRLLRSIGGGSVLGGVASGTAISRPVSSQNDDGDATNESHVTRVVAGPDGAWRFEPETVTIGVGETVEWYFDSSGHNVTSHPDASDKNRNPPGAEPFTSYEGDDHFAVNEEGSTFRYAFTVPGEYEYVCTPHQNSMVGTVTVEACPDESVAVAPDGDLVFDPADLEIGLGETVVWHFEESGHNVTAHPEAAERTAVPDGAEPFASYGADEEAEPSDATAVDHEETREANETYARAFTVPGEYEYVCAIHADDGMAGTIEVRDEPTVEVAVAPDGELTFEPETVSVEVGDVIRWSFEESGHNVTVHPEAAERTAVPDGAEPFASYLATANGADDEPEDLDHEVTREGSETYDHRFVVVGEYDYVCAVHEDEGMVGRIVVEPCSE